MVIPLKIQVFLPLFRPPTFSSSLLTFSFLHFPYSLPLSLISFLLKYLRFWLCEPDQWPLCFLQLTETASWFSLCSVFGALTHVTNCTLEHVAPNWSKNLYRTFYFVLPPSWEYLHTLAFESTEKQRQGARFGQPWISRFIEPRCWLPSFPLWYKIYRHRCGLELVFWGTDPEEHRVGEIHLVWLCPGAGNTAEWSRH